MSLSFTSAQLLTAAQLNALVPVSAVKLADNAAVNNSTTLTNDGDLFLSVAANATYEMSASIRYSSGTTPDIKFGWTYPTGLTIQYDALVIPSGGSTWQMFSLIQTDPLAVEGSTSGIMRMNGIVTVSSTAGTLQLQFAQNTLNVSNTFTKAGSYIRLTQLS